MNSETQTTFLAIECDLASLATTFNDPTDPHSNPGAMLRQAAMLVEAAEDEIKRRTREAVGELVNTAAHANGATGPVPFHVIRERSTI